MHQKMALGVLDLSPSTPLLKCISDFEPFASGPVSTKSPLMDLAEFHEIFALYRAGSRAKCPYLMSYSYGSETLNRYIDPGESKYRTSGLTGSDLGGHPKVKYRYYTQNSAFWRANSTRRVNDLQGHSQGHGSVPWPTFLNFGPHAQDVRKQ